MSPEIQIDVPANTGRRAQQDDLNGDENRVVGGQSDDDLLSGSLVPAAWVRRAAARDRTRTLRASGVDAAHVLGEHLEA